jgi:hypothetical protein
MTKSTLGDAAAKRKVPDGHVSVTRDVADVVRECSNSDGRHGFRVVAKGASGNIYFDRGRVIHAEFGEDCGLRAVVEMLRAGSVQLEPALSWPSQPSLHLGPELLLSLTGGDASRVVRKVDLPVGPPPLPDPQQIEQAESLSPAQPDPARVGKRAISGVMPRVPDRAKSVEHVPGTGDTRASSGPSPVVGAPASGVPSRPSASGSASLAMSRLAASVAESERSQARAAGLRSPTPPPVATRSRLESRGEVVAAARPRATTAPSSHPILRAKKVRSRAIVVAPAASSSSAATSSAATSSAALVPTAAVTASPPKGARPSGREASEGVPLDSGSHRALRPGTPSKAPAASGEHHPTTMVRIAPRGELLAARGRNAEQLAEAAAFIHGLANLIAADFGRHGRANVHLSGGGMSLLVARSEVNDIAAALGPTERLASLLGKVGFK